MIKRGQIFFVDLAPAHGREQTGNRPVLVVSDDSINAVPLVVTVVVGTKAANLSREYPTNVFMAADETGLPLDTVFLCFQIRSLDPRRFIDHKTGRVTLAGTAPDHRMKQIDNSLKLVLNI
jgi:mRNA interferase MazF